WGYSLGAVSAVVANEALTFAAHSILLPRKETPWGVLLTAPKYGLPVVAAVATAITVACKRAEYLVAAIIVVVAILLLGIVRGLGRTSVEHQRRDKERSDVLN